MPPSSPLPAAADAGGIADIGGGAKPSAGARRHGLDRQEISLI
jgi:hypothetical protein